MNIITELKHAIKRIYHYMYNMVLKSRKTHNPSLNEFLQASSQTIMIQKTCRSPATVRNYITATNALKSFIDESNINSNTTQLTTQLVGQFVMWLRNRGISPNTTACYMRSIRALYNYTCDTTSSPFHDVSTANARTHKRAMSIEEVNALINLDLSDSQTLQMYRDIFIFSIYAFGMPFVDVYHMRHDNIQDKAIVYYRHKTGQEIMVPVSVKIMDTISKYRKTGSSYIFPQLHNAEDPLDYNKYQQQLAYYNRALRLLSKKARINRTLTSYVARHTWASIASDSGVGLAHISQALGHTSIKTTQIYLKELDERKIWSVYDNVMEAINKKC